MVSQTVAGQLPREADRQRTFPKPSAAVGMQEEHCGFPRRSGYAPVPPYPPIIQPSTVSPFQHGHLSTRQSTYKF